MSVLGETIKVLRESRKLSLQDVADRSELSKTHVWELERGRNTNPTIWTLCKLSAVLGIDAGALCEAALADRGVQRR